MSVGSFSGRRAVASPLKLALTRWLPRRETITALLFLAPALAYFVLFKWYPMTQAALVSLYAYDLLSPPRFLGLANYASIFTDPVFHEALLNSATYVVGVSVPVWVVALALGMEFNRPGRVRAFFRVVYFLPAIGSVVVIAILWKFLFHPLGLVNALLGSVGIGRIDWLTNSNTAMLALINAGIWRLVPTFMVVYLAGLKGLSHEYYEAAELDGANAWQKLRYITLPLLQPTIMLVVVYSVVLSLRHFINPMLMTGGGPGGATVVLPLLIYQTGFQFSRMGQASAMSMVFFAIMLVFTLLQLRVFRQLSTED